MTISVILLDTRTCIILFCFRYSPITSDDNVPVLQFIVDIFEILKYSNNRKRIFVVVVFFFFFCFFLFLFFFSGRSNFISPNGHQNTGFGVHE